MLTILLTRHGHTDLSEPDRYLGQRIAANLSERGRRDARALGDRLRSVAIDRILSSPLERSLATAHILAEGRAVEVEPDERLSEFDYGSWEGRVVDEVQAEQPDEFALYEANPAIYNVGGGENGIDAARRALSLVNELLDRAAAQRDESTCLLVGHSSINRVLLAAVSGVPLPDYRRRFEQDWTSLSVLRWEDRYSGPLILLLNDMSHVRGGGGHTWS